MRGARVAWHGMGGGGDECAERGGGDGRHRLSYHPIPPSLVIIAKDLVDSLCAKFGWKADIVGVATGAMLEGSTYKHPLYDRTSPVVVGGDYITTESGTGLVHTAPGHGQEDYQVREGVVG